MKILLVEVAIKKFDVAASTVDVLFVFDGKLNNDIFPFVGERREFSANSVESGVLRSFQPCKRSHKNKVKKKVNSDLIKYALFGPAQ